MPALVHFGYGATHEKCAEIAGVSVETIKRDLAEARPTLYAKFFARTRRQKLGARKTMKNPDDAFAKMSQLAKEDPDKLRSMIDQMIARAQGDSDADNPWDAPAEQLSCAVEVLVGIALLVACGLVYFGNGRLIKIFSRRVSQ